MNLDSISLYIHVPFCLSKCSYCDFYSVKSDDKLMEDYTEKICKEVEKWGADINKCVDTVYFGGGTPSLLKLGQIEKILLAIKKRFNLSANAEITMEANPTKHNEIHFTQLRKIGVNRLSVGLQSANDEELRLLGRTHTAKMAKNMVFLAKESGFDNISVDLMLCTPSQTEKSLMQSIEFCESLVVQHISAYLLKIEEGTKFYKKNIKLKSDETQRRFYLLMCDKLENAGFAQYEISNFSKPGFQSKHNLKYWNAEEYIGLGPGAHSFLSGKRFYYKKSLSNFLDKPSIIYDGIGGSVEEYAMLRLRLSEGLQNEKFYKIFHKNIPEKFLENAKMYEKYSLLKIKNDSICLTRKGFLVSNELIAKIIL